MSTPIAYSYIKTLCVDKTFLSRWYEEDTGDTALHLLYEGYRQFYLILLRHADNAEVALDMRKVQNLLYGDIRTPRQWLIDNLNLTLPTEKIPEINPQYVKYGDAFRQGYKAGLTAPGIPVGNFAPESQMTEIILTRPNTDYKGFHDYCLTTVNGYFHHTDYDSKAAYIHDAGQSLRHSRLNQIGIYSFQSVGKLVKLPLKEATLIPITEGAPLKDGFTFDIDAKALDKYVMFSIGGYLIPFTGKCINQIDDRRWRFNITYFNWMDRFFEMARFLDMSFMGIQEDKFNPYVLTQADLFSDATIRKLFAMSQTFAIAIDTPNFFCERQILAKTKTAGVYRTYNFKQMPLMLGHGRMGEYWTEVNQGNDDDPLVGLFVADNEHHQRHYDFTSAINRIAYDEKRPPGFRTHLTDAWWLAMGRDI